MLGAACGTLKAYLHLFQNSASLFRLNPAPFQGECEGMGGSDPIFFRMS
jgi:hypothetical protein